MENFLFFYMTGKVGLMVGRMVVAAPTYDVGENLALRNILWRLSMKIVQECTHPLYYVTQVTTFCALVLNIMGPHYGRCFVTYLTPRILRFFEKFCTHAIMTVKKTD
jgi:hypothetical protein